MFRKSVALLIGAILIAASTLCGAAESRGYRNNNAGNLVKTSIQWQGKVKCKDKRFECFSSPYYGTRAMVKTLVAYKEKHGISSVAGIINRWSPPHENHTASFINYLNHHVGVLGDNFYRKLPLLVHRMIRFENGYEKYSYDFVEGVVNDTVRNYNPPRIDTCRRDYEDVEHEAEDGGTKASADYAGVYRSEGGANRDTRDKGRKVYMDSAYYRFDCSDNGVCTPKGRSADLAGNSYRSVWMDRVGVRVPFLYRW